MGILSPGEQVFLFALLSLFNRYRAMDLCQRYGESIDPRRLAGGVDDERLGVIMSLMQNYAGW